MGNAYLIILWLFLLGGLGTTLWALRSILVARSALHWPRVAGVVETAQAASSVDDLLPDIQYRYTIDGEEHRHSLQFPSGTSPSEQLTRQMLEKYPRGQTVTVYYNPHDHHEVTLEPGPASGDWLVFAFGLGAVILAAFMLAFGW